MKKILISGLYGVNNLGDDYICLSIVSNLYGRYGGNIEITVISNGDNLVWLRRWYPNCKIVNNNGNKYRNVVLTINEIIKADYFIIGGGGLWPSESKKQLILQKLYIKIAVRFCCKVLFFGVEVNELKSEWPKEYWRYFIRNSYGIITRNAQSVRMLSDIMQDNSDKLYESADVTLAFKTLEETNEENRIADKVLPDSGFLLLALAQPWTDAEMTETHFKNRYDKFVSQIVNVVNTQMRGGGGYSSAVFLPFYGGSDIKLIKDIVTGLSEFAVKVIDPDFPIGYKRMLFKQAKHVIAMRFHSVLFSLYYATPFTAISYSGKTSDLMKENGISEHMVEFGIRDNQFFYKEFDLDQEVLEAIINENLDSKEYKEKLINVSHSLKECALSGFAKLFEFLDE